MEKLSLYWFLTIYFLSNINRLDQLEENRARDNNKTNADSTSVNNQESLSTDINSETNCDANSGSSSRSEDMEHLPSSDSNKESSANSDTLGESNSIPLSIADSATKQSPLDSEQLSDLRDVTKKDSSDIFESEASDSSQNENSNASSYDANSHTKENSDDMELVSLEDNENEVIHEIQSGKKHLMSHSQSDIDLSSEERRLELYKNRLTSRSGLQNDTSVDVNKITLPSSESFNDFHYWRQPMASLDIVDSNTSKKEFEVLDEKESFDEKPNIGDEKKTVSDLELEDEIDDQVVLASLTGMNTRTVTEGKSTESKPMNLEELDDLDVIRHDDTLNEVEVIELKPSDSLEGDGIELVVEPLTEGNSELNVEASNVDEDLNTALKEQLQLSKESSELITETEGFLEDIKSETTSDGDDLTLNKDTFSDKGKIVFTIRRECFTNPIISYFDNFFVLYF